MMSIYWRKRLFVWTLLVSCVVVSQDDHRFTPQYFLSVDTIFGSVDDRTVQDVFRNLVLSAQNNASLGGGFGGQEQGQFSPNVQSSNAQNAMSVYQRIGNSSGPAMSKERLSSQDFNNQVLVTALKAKLGPEKFQELIAAIHYKKYGVSRDFLWG